MNQHGKITYSWEGNIFILDIQGPFNEEAVDYYIPILKNSAIKSEFDVWRRLEIWNSEVLASPEVLKLAKNIYDWYENNGCSKTAIVVCNSVQVHMIKDMLKTRAEVFSDVNTAREWLDRC